MARLSRAMRRGGLDWAIFGGLAVRCYGVACRLRDIDIITSASLDTIAEAIPGTHLAQYPGCRARVIGLIEIWPSPLVFRADSREFTFALDTEMLGRVRRITVPAVGRRLPVLSPEDVCVIKALQQRGPESGKHDVDDLRQLWSSRRNTLDHGYLRWRAARTDGATRVAQALAAVET